MADIKDGMSEYDLIIKHPVTYLRHCKGVARAISLIQKPKPHQVAFARKQVFVYYGPTGTGKTRTVHQQAADAGLSLHVQDASMAHWWEGYNDHEAILLDDFRGGHMPLAILLRLLDGYSHRVQQKHGSCLVPASHIWITSDHHPRQWYKCLSGPDINKWEQFKRRITGIVQFTDDRGPICERDMWNDLAEPRSLGSYEDTIPNQLGVLSSAHDAPAPDSPLPHGDDVAD